MRINKFYQNANTFYYRDKFYINDKPIDLGPGEKAKVALSNNDDIESKLEYLNITFIPFIDIENHGRGEYKIETKLDIIDAFNDIGLEALNLPK